MGGTFDRTDGWWAIVGPIGQHAQHGVITTPRDKTRTLDQDHVVGPLALRSGDRLVEYVRSEPTSLGGFTVLESHPILVVGDGTADRFTPAPYEELHRLVCLLSLAWIEPWQLRSGPEPIVGGIEPRVPASWPPPLPWYQPGPPLSAEPQPLPAIVAGGWSVVAGDRGLQSALTMWHQGILLHQRHPTMASLAYCAVLEALGDRLSLDRTESRQVVFEAAVRTWCSPDDLESLSMLFDYGKRSRTVHQARTWADESLFGTLLDLGSASLFGSDRHQGGFGLRALGALRRTSAAGVLAELSTSDL